MQTVQIEKRSSTLTEMQEQSLAALGFAWNIEEINESKSQQMQMVLDVRSIVFYLLYPITILMCFINNQLSHSGK
jgi:hypothetical protein